MRFRNAFQQRPLLTARIDTELIGFEVRVNDVPILTDWDSQALDVELPVNHWLIAGGNTLSICLRPIGGHREFEPDSRCVVGLRVREKDMPASDGQLIASVAFSELNASAGVPAKESALGVFTEADDLDLRISDVQVDSTNPLEVYVSRKIEMRLPFPRWTWLTGSRIPATEVTQHQLLSEVRLFRQLLQGGNVERALQYAVTKYSEIAQAFYLSEREAYDQLTFPQLMKSSEILLDDLEEDAARLEILGNGRLAQLVHEDDRKSLIVFVEKDDTLAYYIPALFCRTAGSWHLVR